jgi:hypothetical protein
VTRMLMGVNRMVENIGHKRWGVVGLRVQPDIGLLKKDSFNTGLFLPVRKQFSKNGLAVNARVQS